MHATTVNAQWKLIDEKNVKYSFAMHFKTVNARWTPNLKYPSNIQSSTCTVLLQHLKQLALDGTAPFAYASFEFPLVDHLHLCRQSFCFRVHQSNEPIKRLALPVLPVDF
jgi:hypothetical protein